MGIYIEGVEMPKSCYQCGFLFRPERHGKVYCTAVEPMMDISKTISDKRASNCPLIPVPDHGRLIDADVMKKSVKLQTFLLRLLFPGELEEIANVLEEWVMKEIDNAPTIVPADKEGEE